MSSDKSVVVTGLSKELKLFNRPSDRLSELFMFGLTRRHIPKLVLNDINFEVARGESMAIVGVNGSGKSTLLQMICGTMTPTKGSIDVYGRVAALLELGAGFNPDFTGKENARISMAVAGMADDEIEDRLEEAVEFSEIGVYADQPVKSYSSGMFMRMAFASSIVCDPDILVIDEALSVGDVAFQLKCFKKIDELRDRGASFILVSHDAETVRSMTSRALLLDNGNQVAVGSSAEIIAMHRRMAGRGIVSRQAPQDVLNHSPIEVEVLQDGSGVNGVASGDPVTLRVRFRVEEKVSGLDIRILLRGPRNTKLYATGTINQDRIDTLSGGKIEETFWSKIFEPDVFHTVEFRIPSLTVGPGLHEVEASIIKHAHLDTISSGETLQRVENAARFFVDISADKPIFEGLLDLGARAYANTPGEANK